MAAVQAVLPHRGKLRGGHAAKSPETVDPNGQKTDRGRNRERETQTLEGKPERKTALDRYLSPLDVWGMAFGVIVGWGVFAMPGNTFLPLAGPAETVIAMTANAFAEDVRAAENAGMDGHIAKPVDVLVLKRTVTDVLNRKSRN